MLRRGLKLVYSLVLVLVVSLAGLIGYAVGQGGSYSTYTISSGVYPGAPNYTVYCYNSTFYAAKYVCVRYKQALQQNLR